MPTFELDLSQSPEFSTQTNEGLGSDLLINNARWFIRIRWFVAVVFALAALAILLFRPFVRSITTSTPIPVFFALSAVLICANGIFIALASRFDANTPVRPVRIVIWGQILTDLAVVTVMVYVVGSTTSFVSFTYLFHIALACIFFPPKESLAVALTAMVLYGAIALLQLGGVIPDIGMFQGRAAEASPIPENLQVFQVATAIFVWLVVWYLVSTLSEGVRRRDRQLQHMNRQLVEADSEKNQQMLVITHDLKAPFSGIESNIEVLKVKFWDSLSQDARDIIERINGRSRVLRQRINAILMLGELRSQNRDADLETEILDVEEIIRFVCDDLADRAADRNEMVTCNVVPARVRSNRKKLIVLFENLISNAINYSLEGGTIEVRGEIAGDSVRIEVADHGIGIRPDALPHIFDEYFRSREAARFNRSSTGLGLAIVREIAAHLRLGVTVESEEGKGTRVSVVLPNVVTEDSKKGEEV